MNSLRVTREESSSRSMSLTEGVDLQVLFGEDIASSVDDLFSFEVDETSEEETVEQTPPPRRMSWAPYFSVTLTMT